MSRPPRTIALLFPGQLAIRRGFGLDLLARPSASWLARVGSALEVDLPRLLERGGAALATSELVQPLLVAVCAGYATELLAAGIRADYVAGLSLGELPAWVASGAVDARPIVDFAIARGRVMAELARRRPGGMIAIVAPDAAAIEHALSIGAVHGTVVVAGRNTPNEVVLSGDEAAIFAIARAIPSTRLAAAGPWHSPAMSAAIDTLRPRLAAIPRRRPSAAFVSNHTGELAAADDIVEHLLAQLVAPVRWADSLRRLAACGVTDFVAIAEPKVLRNHVRETVGMHARVHAIAELSDVAPVIARLSDDP